MELQMKDYMKMIKKRLWMIVSLVLAVSVLTGVVSYKFIQPVYEASVKLIVTKAQEFQGTQMIDYGSIDANIKLVNTYKEIIKTPAIMDKVVQQYPDLGLDSIQLIEKVNVNSANESQVMTISMEDVSYDRGAQIVNAIAEVFKNQIPTIMKIDNVTILNEANEAIRPLPVKPNPKLNIAISFILSLMVALCLVFILEYLDDSIKTEQDVKNYLGIPTLGVISKIKTKEMQANSAAVVAKITGGDSTYVSANQ
jgi:capsular polysaccharide biosynthesis protein